MKNRVGEIWTSNEGYKMTIIGYNTCEDCTIQFDNGITLKNQNYSNINKGAIKNPYHPSIFGKGYIGEGKHKSRINNKYTKVYSLWSHMLGRCYDETFKKKHPTYIGCTVHPDWHNFQIFAQWFEDNYIEGRELDKDILIKGNKIYSSETCCFVPQEVNKIINKRNNARGNYPIGVSKENGSFIAKISIDGKSLHLGYFKTPEKAFKAYKKAKEKYIKDMAKLCKDILPEQAYQSLINHKIEITD